MAERWLVIDDSATIQRVIKLAFQDYDVIITEADSCPDAARDILRNPPALVIADAAVGGVQSVQDFVNLRNQAPQTPFIILEGSYDNIDETQFRSAGFRHFLKKPFDAAQLLAVTRQALGRALPYRAGEASIPPPPPSRGGRSTREDALNQAFMPDTNPGRGVDLGIGESRSAPTPGPTSGASIQTSGASVLAATAPHGKGAPGVGGPRATQTTRPMASLDKPMEVAKRGISFSLEDESEVSPTPDPRRETVGRGGGTGLQSMLEPMLQEEMERLVRGAVEEYCRKNFAQIARELISKELDRLTQERSRLLVDK